MCWECKLCPPKYVKYLVDNFVSMTRWNIIIWVLSSTILLNSFHLISNIFLLEKQLLEKLKLVYYSHCIFIGWHHLRGCASKKGSCLRHILGHAYPAVIHISPQGPVTVQEMGLHRIKAIGRPQGCKTGIWTRALWLPAGCALDRTPHGSRFVHSFSPVILCLH